MPGPDLPSPLLLFSRTLDECRELYVSSGRLCAREYPQLVSRSPDEFVELMDDLHRALVLKVYFSVCEADRRWSSQERCLAEALFDHLWNQRLTGDNLRTAAKKAAEEATKLPWYNLVRPFDDLAPLRDRVGTLETLVVRLANIVGRADGRLAPTEAATIKSIQDELHHHLRPIPLDEPGQHETADALAANTIDQLRNQAGDVYTVAYPPAHSSAAGSQRAAVGQAQGRRAQPPPSARPAVDVEDALAELDSLIGLARIKDEVRTLTNFLKLQQRRTAAGLPDIELSLHMVFTGNPGTGKTTVARIIGQIFASMGILRRGHLVETDRSGLVAEFIGQTGPKTHAKIDEALDGVLFIDEAYSLVSQDGQDPYGSEAVQALLKRAEDNRERLVVILAGYPVEMQALLSSNPGLMSRFNRQLQFDDYSPLELARIFSWLCKKNRYSLAPSARARLMLGLAELHRRRDRTFGNGRSVRNLFEQAVRRMANRIADIAELTAEQLMLLEASDLVFEGLSAEVDLTVDDGRWRFHVGCPKCHHASDVPGSYLGRRVRCPKCKHKFVADWGEPVAASE
jgi:hypothetical protein